MMKVLRDTLDQHEKTVVADVTRIKQEQTATFERHGTSLKFELRACEWKKITLKLIDEMQGHMKVLQSRPQFDSYVSKANETLGNFRMPRRIEYYLANLEQSDIIKQTILQCGAYKEVPPYNNPALTGKLANAATTTELILNGMELKDADMPPVAAVLETSTVSVTE